MKKIRLIAILICIGSSAFSQTVSTLAGQSGVSGAANGTGTAAQFDSPHGVAVDAAGNVYVADRDNNKIRKITPAGVVTTFAGSGLPGSTDGTGTAATFFEPWGIAIDAAGNLYVADTKNYKIRKITPAGVVTTLAGDGTSGVTDGTLATAQFGFPTGIALDGGGFIYVCEYNTHTIRKISNGNVSTFAGTSFLSGDVNGTGAAARFDHPHSMVCDASGNIYVTDSWNNKIKKITPAGVVSTFAGSGVAGFANGTAAAAQFDMPLGITKDASGNIYVGDVNNFSVRKIAAGAVTTFAGTPGTAGDANGPVATALLNSPSSLTFLAPDKFYVGDEGNELIRVINTAVTILPLTLTTTGSATTFCQGTAATVTATPSGLTNYTFKDAGVTILTNNTGVLPLTGLSAGTHTITCTATGGASQYATTTTLTITIVGSATATVSPAGPLTLCGSGSITLTASAGSTYLWSNGATTPTISVSQAGNYSVTVTYAGGCTSGSNTVTVSNGTAFTATITPATPPVLCAGDSILLTATLGSSYAWSNGKTTRSIYVKTAGSYYVVVTNGSGCSSTSTSVIVTVSPIPTATITPGGPVTITQGQTATFTANASSGYLWNTGATTQTITVGNPGTYWVKVQNAAGCYSLADSVVLNVTSISSVSITSVGATIICPGDSVELTSSVFFGNQWYKNNVAIPNATSQTYFAKDAGSYTTKVTIPGNTLTSNAIVVTLKTIPATLDAVNDSVCMGGIAELNVVPQTGVVYHWYTSPTGGNYINTGSTYLTGVVQQTTTMYVDINANGCVSVSRFPVLAYVYPEINPSFTAAEAVKAETGFAIAFTNTTTTTGLAYAWNFGDVQSQDNTSFDESPTHNFTAEGNYTVVLIATNAEGCSDSTVQVVDATLAHDLFLPSAFTPNNDGVNDVFRLKGNGYSNASMAIINQWGQVVYKSDNAALGWDGNAGSRTAQNGTYSYMVKITMKDGSVKLMKGNISLIK